MTGGTQNAKRINENIARVCKDFGMGMGLGSCRVLLKNDTHLEVLNTSNTNWNDRETDLFTVAYSTDGGFYQPTQPMTLRDWWKNWTRTD